MTATATPAPAKPKTNRGRRWLAVVGMVVLLAGVGFTVKDMIHSSGSAKPGRDAAGGLAERLEVRSFGYVPRSIVAAPGRSLRLRLTNFGFDDHTFTIDKLGVDVVLKPGESKTVSIPAEGPGRVWFYCRFHQSLGMTGQLIIRTL